MIDGSRQWPGMKVKMCHLLVHWRGRWKRLVGCCLAIKQERGLRGPRRNDYNSCVGVWNVRRQGQATSWSWLLPREDLRCLDLSIVLLAVGVQIIFLLFCRRIWLSLLPLAKPKRCCSEAVKLNFNELKQSGQVLSMALSCSSRHSQSHVEIGIRDREPDSTGETG